MELSGIDTINKLVLLFVFDKIEFPVTENSLIELFAQTEWLTYMDLQHTLSQLIDKGFVYKSDKQENNNYHSITPDGRQCISHFYSRIPASLRTEISDYIRDNRMKLRRKQEYYSRYDSNLDGTYTVSLKIMDPIQTSLEIRLNVANRSIARKICSKWEKHAATMYYNIHETLIE